MQDAPAPTPPPTGREPGLSPSVGVALGVFAISFAPVFVEATPKDDLGPTGIALGRTAIGAVALLGLALARRERLTGSRRAVGLAALAGALFAGDLWVWHRAIDAVGGGLATLLGNVQVFWTGLVGALVLHERSGRRLALAAPLALVGLALATEAFEGGLLARDPAGVALGLATSFFYAAYVLVVRRAQQVPDRLAPVAMMTWTSAACAVTSLGLGWADGGRLVPGSARALGLVAGLGIVGQGLGWVTIATFVPRVPVSRAGLLLLLQPACSLVWAALLFGRTLSPWQVVGAVLTLAAIYVGSTPGYTRPRPPARPPPRP